MRFRKIKYHMKYYIFIFLYFFLAYSFIFITFGAYNSQIEDKRSFFSYLKDDYMYGEGFRYDSYLNTFSYPDGVLYNVTYNENHTIYYYSGDYTLGIPYSVREVLTITKTKKISDNGIIVNYEMYKANDFKDTIIINDQTYGIKEVIYIKYPKVCSLYEDKTIEKFNFALIEDNTITNSDFAIITYHGENEVFFSDYIIGYEHKKGSEGFIQMYVLLLNIVMIIPILFILFTIIFIYDYISKKYIIDLNNKVILGATIKHIFNNIFFELISISFIGLLLSYICSFLICLMFNIKLTFTILFSVFAYSILLSYLFAKIKSKKIYKKYLGGKKC